MRQSVEFEVRSAECGVRTVKSGRAQVMFLDNNSATGSHKARTGLGGAQRTQVR